MATHQGDQRFRPSQLTMASHLPPAHPEAGAMGFGHTQGMIGKITPEFAYELLLCEMNLECCPSIEKKLVARMFELYKQAVEHFNLRHDPREAYFTGKLQHLTNHPSVLSMLHSEHERQDNFYKKRHMERLVEINAGQTQSEIEEMIRKVEDSSKKNGETVRRHLSVQLKALERRIEARKQGSKTLSETGNEHRMSELDDQTLERRCHTEATEDTNKENCRSNAFTVSQRPCRGVASLE